MAARQYLKIWNEAATGQGATYGADPFSPPGSPVLNTDYILVRLTDNNPFTMRQNPIQKPIRSADGLNRRVQMAQSQFSLQGTLSTLMYPTQMPFIANLLTLNSSSADLPSFVCDHAIVMESGTTAYRRYVGCKFDQVTIGGDSSNNVMKISANIMAKQAQTTNITSANFPEPAFNTYPQESPYLFTNLSSPGYTNINSTSRSEYKAFSIVIDPILDGTYNESIYITRLKFCGRNVDWTDSFVYQSTTDRTEYEAGTQLASCAVSLNTGSHSCTFTLNSAVVITSVDDDLGLSNVNYQTIKLASMVDPTAGTDLSISAN